MDILNLLEFAAKTHPKLNQIYQKTKPILETPNRWRENIIQLANQHNKQISSVKPFLQKGTKTRNLIDKYAPKGFIEFAEHELDNLARKQNNPSKHTSQSSQAYKILPVNLTKNR